MITLETSLLENLRRVDDPIQGIRDALQAALQLEHATLAVYLYAFYSLDAERNGVVAEVIQSVFMEEMVHMALVANLLNAVDGRPVLAPFQTAPTYPGPLPGGVEESLTVHLAPFSSPQLETFLQIEEPEDPLEFRSGFEEAPLTIGQFYRGILQRIEELEAGGDTVFTGDPSRQLSTAVLGGITVITDLASARQAIATIVEQGEGTKEFPLEAANSPEPAHYYRFMGIKKGKTLIPNPDAGPDAPPEERFIYDGDEVEFDLSGVFALPTDLKPENFAIGSTERTQIDQFNQAYSEMLAALQTTFNGAPDTIFRAVSVMRQLSRHGAEMVPVGIGPTFEYGEMVNGRFTYHPTT